MTLRVLATTGCALAAAALAPIWAGAQAEAPNAREAKELFERAFELDWKSFGKDPELDALLAKPHLVRIEDEQAAKSWLESAEKLWKKAPELGKKSGRHFLWESDDEQRGLYIVGGRTKKPKGLFIGMHGGGAGSGDAWSAHGEFNSAAEDMEWVAIFPEVLEKTARGWTDSGTEEFVVELVERAIRTFDVPRDQVFFGGHSMGGFGSWVLGAHHADMVCGLMPSAGAPGQVWGPSGQVEDVESGVIPNLRNVSLAIYQSADDVQVPPVANRVAVKKLEEARARWGGYDFEYWEVPGRGHAPPPGGMEALTAKMQGKKRNARPDKICWQGSVPWKRQQYWLWWDQPSPTMVIVAELDRATNSVRIEAESTIGAYALLDDDALDLQKEVKVIVNGAELWSGMVQRDLGTLTATPMRGDPALAYTARVPLWN